MVVKVDTYTCIKCIKVIRKQGQSYAILALNLDPSSPNLQGIAS